MKTLRIYTIVWVMLLLLLASACKNLRKASSDKAPTINGVVLVEEPELVEEFVEGEGEMVEWSSSAPVYKGAATRFHHVLHTLALLSYSWDKEEVYGSAALTLEPFRHASKQLKLDAKGMELHQVALVDGKDTIQLPYDYDESNITIELPRVYERHERFVVLVHYTARPSAITGAGGEAITDNKGWYFINPNGVSKGLPTQIWTQGETHYTSCWLPTIDQPNQKMTQELRLTVADTMMTLSNGKKTESVKHGNGMRTDIWKLEKPHAPYLACVVIGQFAEIKTEALGGKVPVGYYHDPRYANSNGTIFGNTPEMIKFFSELLDYPFPWPKYDQVVVHQFVSGAMENTGITVHGDMLMLDSRELLDQDYEDVIAHELVHQWFGNLVTCESWAQLPLNESFATYGEYLWREYKYGREEADRQLEADRRRYLNEASDRRHPLIHFHYGKPDDQFDGHSYQKGSCVLHMLRSYLGDDRFFGALRSYLKLNEFQTANIYDLKRAFEMETGEDLTWFFDQWFHKEGHPELELTHSYNQDLQAYTIEVDQVQDLSKNPIFRIPTEVKFVFKDSTAVVKIWIDKLNQTFSWPMPSMPLHVVFDPYNIILGKVIEQKTEQRWLAQVKHGQAYLEKRNALKNLEDASDEIIIQEAVNLGLADPYWKLKEDALVLYRSLSKPYQQEFHPRLVDLATKHPKSQVRSAAYFALTRISNPADLTLALNGLNDSSYLVVSSALNLLYSIDTDQAINHAIKLSDSKNDRLQYTALSILSTSNRDFVDLFAAKLNEQEELNIFLLIYYFRYLNQLENPLWVAKGLNAMNSIILPANEEEAYMMVSYIYQFNETMKEKYQKLNAELEKSISKTKDSNQKQNLETLKKGYQLVLDNIMK